MQRTNALSKHLRVVVVLLIVLASRLHGTKCRADEPDRPTESKKPLCRVTFLDPQMVQRMTDARLLIEAQDGGLLIEAHDGRLWNVPPKQLVKLERFEQPFQPLPPAELGTRLQTELVAMGIESESQVIATPHFVLCSTAGKKYAEWVGGLLERLHDGFFSFWKTNGLPLSETEFPLPVIVLKNQAEFARFATQHDGPDAAQSHGYYSIPSNRVVMFDLTAGPNSTPAKTFEDIRRKIVASPFNVATVIHEATHQLAFNSGLHRRYTDNPMWLTEGMAMFFEVPDLDSRTGWRSIGQLNKLRWRDFQETNKRRDELGLVTLLRDDARFQSVETGRQAYAESWALTYFLLKTRKTEYVRYLRVIQSKPLLVADSPEVRQREFSEQFGDDLAKLDKEFRQWMARRRP